MIAIITYDAPHRKTQDLLTKLLLNGYSQIHLIATPWTDKKPFQPIFKHRPSNRVDVTTEEMCRRLRISFSKVNTDTLDNFLTKNSFKHILIAGAGLLPADLALKHKIINSHPGYLPNTKGLDALKWSIFNNQPIGVTTHYISDKADEGILIERRIVPVYFEDSFHNVAYRVYETEIDMLVNSIKEAEKTLRAHESLTDDRYAANMRMSHHHELIMMERFEELRKKSKSGREEM